MCDLDGGYDTSGDFDISEGTALDFDEVSDDGSAFEGLEDIDSTEEVNALDEINITDELPSESDFTFDEISEGNYDV